MEAKELRIGNYVLAKCLDDQNYYEQTIITEILFDGVSHDAVGMGKPSWNTEFTNIKPIPITEEWLFKIKQAKPESRLNLSFVFNSSAKMWVDKSNEENRIWHYVWNGKYIQVKYLHHLQNIHYYLNNFEELTL